MQEKLRYTEKDNYLGNHIFLMQFVIPEIFPCTLVFQNFRDRWEIFGNLRMITGILSSVIFRTTRMAIGSSSESSYFYSYIRYNLQSKFLARVNICF